MMIMSILNHFLELFFPRLCPCCKARLVEQEPFLCLECLFELPETDHLKYKDNKLEEFFAGRFPFERIVSFAYFVKGGSIQKIIHQIKYKDKPRLAVYIGELCGKQIASAFEFKDIDYIVPIPLHPKRLRDRGYNQSLKLAEGISAITKITIESDNLVRVINNPSQTKNTRFERWKNTDGIFAIKNKTIYKNKHILLIDDVVTTGSTLEVCAKLLLSCDSTRISIYTVGSAI